MDSNLGHCQTSRLSSSIMVTLPKGNPCFPLTFTYHGCHRFVESTVLRSREGARRALSHKAG